MKITRATFCEYAEMDANGDLVCPNPCTIKKNYGVMMCKRAQMKYEQYLLKEQDQKNKKEKTVNINVNKKKTVTKKKK